MPCPPSPAHADHCPYCSLQCGFAWPRPLWPAELTLLPQPDFPTNRGGLCAKGWTAASLLDHPDRLLTPLVRAVPGDRDRCARPSWEEALDVVAADRGGAQPYGRDAVGCFGGGGLTNEKAYQLGKFARVALRTSTIDYNGRFCMSSAATAGQPRVRHRPRLPFPLATSPRPRRAAGRQQSGRHHAAGHAVLRRRPGQRRRAHRGRPAAHRHRGRRAAAPAAAARHRPGAGQRPAAHRDPGGPDRRGVHRRPDHGFRRGRAARLGVLAGPGGADHRRPGRRKLRRGVRTLAAARRRR